MLESGGSLFGSGSGNSLDCSNPLNDYSCNWATGKLMTNSSVTLTHSTDRSAKGIDKMMHVAYYEEEPDYGYQEEDMTWYDDEYDEWLDPMTHATRIV